MKINDYQPQVLFTKYSLSTWAVEDTQAFLKLIDAQELSDGTYVISITNPKSVLDKTTHKHFYNVFTYNNNMTIYNLPEVSFNPKEHNLKWLTNEIFDAVQRIIIIFQRSAPDLVQDLVFDIEFALKHLIDHEDLKHFLPITQRMKAEDANV